MGFITTTDEHIASGGTISGNLTIDADLNVTGSTAITTNEVIQGTSIIDINNTEALLVRKDSDGGDIFTVDTTNSEVELGVDVKLKIKDSSYSGQLSINSSGYTELQALGDRSIDLKSQRQIRMYTSDDGASYTQALNLSSTGGNATFLGNVTVGSDGSGKDVTFYSATAGDSFVWDASEEKLTITGTDSALALDIADGYVKVQESLSITNGAGSMYIWSDDPFGTNYEVLRIDKPSGSNGRISVYKGNTGTYRGLSLETGSSGEGIIIDSSSNVAIANNLDVDGTTNLDAVDIDGAVQIDSTLTVGVNDTGQDVKFFGATSGKYMMWDESGDDLIVYGAIGINGTPTADFHIFGQTVRHAYDTPELVLEDTSAFSAGTGPSIYLQGKQTGEVLQTFAAIQGVSTSGANECTLIFKTRTLGSTTEKMRIDTDGKVTLTGNIIMADDTSIGIADDAERIEFDGAGDISVLGANFGIGSTAPPALLTVADGVGTVPTLSAGDLAVFQNNDNTDDIAVVTIISGNAGSGYLVFGDAEDKNRGRIQYDHSSNSMKFTTDDSEKLIINSSGNLGVGNSSPDTLVLVGNNASNTDNGIKISANGTGHPYLQFANSDSATNHVSKAMIFQDTTNSWYQGNLVIAIDETGDTSTVAAADEVIRIGAGSTVFSNIVDITNTTDASDDSGDTGALRVEGGASIAKKLYVGGATTVGENDATASSLGIGTDASITANTTKLQIGNHNTAVSAIYLTDNDAQDDWYIASNSTLAMGYNNSAKLSITQAGDVGINTTAPETKFTIDQTADDNGIRIYGYDDVSSRYGEIFIDSSGYLNIDASTDRGIEIKGHANDFYVNSGADLFVRMTYDSKLGVGTTTPSEVLTVSGNIDLKNSSGFAKIDNSGSLSMADDATVTLSSSRNGSALILVYEVGSGIGALFYTCFGLAVTKLAGTSLTANSDSDGDLCCYNSGHTITVKNRLGATKTVVITVLGGNVY